MRTIERDLLAGVTGGFKWEDLPPSTNVEDRRHWSRRRSMNAPVEYLPPPQVGPRTPNDLPHQAGLDDIDDFVERWRRAHPRRRP